MTDKPVIVLYGNCHVGFTRNVLARLDVLTEAYEIWWVRNFKVNSSLTTGFDLEKLRRCDYFILQVGHWDTDSVGVGTELLEMLPPHCRIIRVPPLFLNSLWPFMVNDPRNWSNDLNTEGPYPNYIANRVILRLMQEETDPDRVFEIYMSKDIGSLVDLDRLHGINLAQLDGIDLQSDIALTGFIENNFREKRLFLSQLHPTGPLSAEIARQIVGQLDLVKEDDPQLLETLDEVEAMHGIGDIDAPIHPGIADHFGLEWARGLTFRYFDEGHYDHDTFVKRYIRFTNVPEYFPARALMNQKNWCEAELLLRKSIEKSPESPRFHACLGQTLYKQGRLEEAERTYETAIALDCGKDGYYADLAKVQLHRDPRAALKSIDKAAETQTPSLEISEIRLAICNKLAEPCAISSAEADVATARERHRWPPFLEPTGAIYGRYWLPEGGSGF